MIAAPKTRALAIEMATAAAAYLNATDPEEAASIIGAVQAMSAKPDAHGDCWFCGSRFELGADRLLPYHRRPISATITSAIRCDGTGHAPGKPARAGAAPRRTP